MKKLISLSLMVLLFTVCLDVGAEEKLGLSQGLIEKQIASNFIAKKDYLNGAFHYEKAALSGLNQELALRRSLALYQKAEAYESANRVKKLLEQVKADRKKNDSTHLETQKGVIILTDIDNFFQAFVLAKNLNFEEKLAVYAKYYFDQASPGLVDYATLKIRGLESFVDYVENARPYYEDVAQSVKKLKALLPEANNAMARARFYLADAVIPNIYFLMGMHTSGGTASSAGLLLGADFVAESLDNTHLIRDWAPNFISAPENKLHTIVHEYAHYLQGNSGETLLDSALREGGADFFANLLYKKQTKAAKYSVYGLAHEKRIWQKFMSNLDSTDTTLWIGNNGHELPQDWVADLGYFIGNQIATRYYENSEDKKQAVIDLLALKNPKQILQKSGYDKSFK